MNKALKEIEVVKQNQVDSSSIDIFVCTNQGEFIDLR